MSAAYHGRHGSGNKGGGLQYVKVTVPATEATSGYTRRPRHSAGTMTVALPTALPSSQQPTVVKTNLTGAPSRSITSTTNSTPATLIWQANTQRFSNCGPSTVPVR